MELKDRCIELALAKNVNNSCLFDEEHCSPFFLWSIWYLSFRILFLLHQQSPKKPQWILIFFVTGVKHTSWCLLRPCFNAVRCMVTHPSIIRCKNAVQGFSDTIKNPVDDSAKTKLKCWEVEQYSTLKWIAVQSRGVSICQCNRSRTLGWQWLVFFSFSK